MIINKAQGQSLQTVDVDLQNACFEHGQLYVALFQVTDVSNLSILFQDVTSEKTENIVYLELL